MERRSFLTTAAVAPFAAAAGISIAQDESPQGSKNAVTVENGKDRFNTPVRFPVGHIECKISGKDTNGELYVFETLTPREDRPARHLHHNQDEWFYILSGEYEFEIGDDKYRLKSGDCAFAPRKVAHVWACVSDAPGKMLVVLQPAGKLEDFFRELPKYGASSTPEDFAKLYADHEMQVTGPPLPFS